MNDSILIKEEKNQIVTLTLNRTEVMNSFNFALLLALKAEIDELQFDKDVRVIIITGGGKKAFCSGADLKERITLAPVQVRKYIFTIRNLFTSIEQLNKPVIAGINGIALGGGTEEEKKDAQGDVGVERGQHIIEDHPVAPFHRSF